MGTDIVKTIIILIYFLTSLFLIVQLVALPIIYLDSIGEYAEIECLRETIVKLGIDSRTENILGKVAEVNMNLKKYKAYNKIPIIKWWIPNNIANLELINIPL